MYFVCIMFPQLESTTSPAIQLQFDSSSQLHPMKSWNTSPIDIFLNNYGRKRQQIIGDGNCLFRSFSFILHNTEEKHLYLRQAIVEVIVLNEERFRPYCLPDTVTEHAEKMKSNCVWGTQAEIFAFSVLVGKPIFVATINQSATYYWAKHMCTLKFSPFKFTPLNDVPVHIGKLRHLEICNVGGVHYDAVLTRDGQIPVTPPYNEDRLTSAKSPIVLN